MKKKQIETKKIISIIIIIICTIGLLYSIFNIIKWKKENDKTKKIKENIKTNIDIENISKNESILDNYSINFEELSQINSEIVGYIKIENTDIDSTIVKHSDNDYYLNHSFDKSWSSAGWLFSNYKNRYDGTDKNYVIFGHARKDGSMFGTLKKTLTEQWYNNQNNIIFITKNKKYLFQVFSVYKIKAEEYYITPDFEDDLQFGNYINIMKSRSIKDFNNEVSIKDTLLTLSTCDDNNEYRIVLHAKAIEIKN